jgi:tetratricopeptide (TPR) repeat protein
LNRAQQLSVAADRFRDLGDNSMPSVRRRAIPWKSFLRCILATLALLSLPSIRAGENPAKSLQAQFEAAKASLTAGDLGSAERHYIDAVTLGLRAVAQLSLSEGQVDQAAAYLDSGLKLKPEDAETQVDAAGVWFRKGEVSRAKELLKSVVAKQPNNARARGLLGRIYVFEGDSDNATQELKASVDLQDDFETDYFLGIALLKGKRLDDVNAWFNQLQAKMGDSAALHVLFGRAYLITKVPQQAITEFGKAIALDPKYPRAHAFLGYAYLEHYQEEGYPRARPEFEKEIKFHPDEYRAYELLGITNVNLRDYAAAETALLHAIRLQPKEASLYLYLGETYAATNRIEAAVKELEKYVNMVGNPEDDKLREASRAYYLLGQNLQRLGRREEAARALAHSQQLRESKFKYDVKHIFDEKKAPEDDRESRVSDPVADLLGAGSFEEKQGAQNMVQQGLPAVAVPKPPAAGKETAAAKQYRAFVGEILGSSYNDLGVMRAKESKFSQAADFFRQAAAWRPDLPGLDRNWGFASFRAELYTEAVPPLERELRTHPEDSFARQVLGLSYSMLENDAKVVEVLRPFLENPPDDPGLLLAWGTSLVRTRQSEAAANIFRRLLAQNNDNASVHLMLGQAFAQQENFPNALAELKTALQLDPRLPDGHYYTGLVYLHKGEFESAEQEFRAELQLQPEHALAAYHLGYALLAQGHSEDAVPLFRAVIKEQPQYESAHFELGRALLEQGDAAGAIASLETARKLVPEHDAVYFQLSRAYRQAGRTEEAAQALATYQKLIDSNRLKKRKSMETETP